MPYPYYLPMAPRQTGTIHHVPMQGLVTPFGGVTALPGSPPPIGSLAGPGLLALMNAARPILIFPSAAKGGGGGGGGGAPAKKAAATTTTTTTTPPAAPPAEKPATTPPVTPPAAPAAPTAPAKTDGPYIYYNPVDGYLYTEDPYGTLSARNAKRIAPLFGMQRMPDGRIFDPTPGSGGSARQGKFLGYLKEATLPEGLDPSSVPTYPLSENPNGVPPGGPRVMGREYERNKWGRNQPIDRSNPDWWTKTWAKPGGPPNIGGTFPNVDNGHGNWNPYADSFHQRRRDIDRLVHDSIDNALGRPSYSGLTDPIDTGSLPTTPASDPIAEAADVKLSLPYFGNDTTTTRDISGLPGLRASPDPWLQPDLRELVARYKPWI